MPQDYNVTHTITAEEYMNLREAVGWTLFPLEEAQAGIDNSFVYCIRDSKKPVAMGRLVTDHGYVVYIADVIVDPGYQGQGLGRELMEALLAHIRSQMKPGYKIMVSLLSAKGKEGFYEKFGFTNRNGDNFGAGMCVWLAE